MRDACSSSSPSPIVQVIVEYNRAEMARRGRLGGLATRSRHDPADTTKAGRAAFLSRFTSDDDRRRYFADLSQRATEARRAQREAAA